MADEKKCRECDEVMILVCLGCRHDSTECTCATKTWHTNHRCDTLGCPLYASSRSLREALAAHIAEADRTRP